MIMIMAVMITISFLGNCHHYCHYRYYYYHSVYMKQNCKNDLLVGCCHLLIDNLVDTISCCCLLLTAVCLKLGHSINCCAASPGSHTALLCSYWFALSVAKRVDAALDVPVQN
jgi:hypothetical protein